MTHTCTGVKGDHAKQCIFPCVQKTDAIVITECHLNLHTSIFCDYRMSQVAKFYSAGGSVPPISYTHPQSLDNALVLILRKSILKSGIVKHILCSTSSTEIRISMMGFQNGRPHFAHNPSDVMAVHAVHSCLLLRTVDGLH